MFKAMMKKLARSKKGAALVEYALLIAGVALVSAAAVSVFGSKTGDMIAGIAAILPGAQAEDNASIVVGQLIETGADANNDITIAADRIDGNIGTQRYGNNMGIPLDALIIDTNDNAAGT